MKRVQQSVDGCLSLQRSRRPRPARARRAARHRPASHARTKPRPRRPRRTDAAPVRVRLRHGGAA
eukprot:3743864-Prymnesium_polylepis.1